MKPEIKSKGFLSIEPCSYGLSKVQFRGPRRPTDSRYAVFLGGSNTFGKYIPKPFPDLIETAIGEVCVNLGCQSAGPDVFLHDAAIELICHDAAATVIQVIGAANLSNRFYRVHPRRNDRFTAPSETLMALYPEIDFTEIAFTGHLIRTLRGMDIVRFEHVQAELEQAWAARMKSLIALSNGPVFLLWLAERTPDEDVDFDQLSTNDPIFVGRSLLEQLRPHVADIIEVVSPINETDGMSFAPLEALSAQELMGVEAHQRAAEAMRGPLLYALS